MDIISARGEIPGRFQYFVYAPSTKTTNKRKIHETRPSGNNVGAKKLCARAYMRRMLQ